MNLRLALLRVGLPGFVRRAKLRELFGITARAFGTEAPRLDGLTCRECLERYARFTRERADVAVRKGSDLRETEERLFTGAREMGETLRRQLGVRTPEEFATAMRLLYRAMEIDLRVDSNGEIIVRTCFFSAFYSGEVCRLIASLDKGIAAGLSGGGELDFTGRITEGGGCCRAKIVFRGDES